MIEEKLVKIIELLEIIAGKSNALDEKEPGRIVDAPDPEIDRINKERVKDLSLGGVLKKNNNK